MIFCLEPGQVHHWEFTEKPEGYVLMFKTEFLKRFQISNLGKFDVDECIHLNSKYSQLFEQFFKSIEDELENKRENFKNTIGCYLNIMLIELERLSNKSNDQGKDVNSKFAMFNELVRQKFRTEKKVQAYAEMLHISSKHLNALCKESSGKTASNIIQNQVGTEAKRLLIYTDKNISEIAYELGFDDSSHFAKFFKKQLGVSPTLFRKNRFQ